MSEKYTPREQDVLSKSRKIVDEEMKAAGAQETQDGQIQFTSEQKQLAKDEMGGAKKREKENPVDTALSIKINKMNNDLLPVWNEMSTLKDKLPYKVSQNLAELEGKYHSSHKGLSDHGGNELAKLRDQRDYIKAYKNVHPDENSDDLSRFEKLLNDPNLDEYWRTKQEQEAVRKQK